MTLEALDGVPVPGYTAAMRKVSLLLVVMVIVGIGTFLVFRYAKSAGSDIKPEVLDIGNSQVTIAWLSKDFYKGRVFYKPAGSGAVPLSATESFGPAGRHEVVIFGLSSSTRYTYWVEGSNSRFQFQTQPLSNTPFSFLIVWGDISERIVSLMMSEVPEFIISLTAVPEEGPDWFSDVRPYVPIYGLSGIDSVFLRAVEGEHAADSGGSWKLDWGGLRLLFIDGVAEMEDMLNTSAAHTFAIVTSPEVVEAFKPQEAIDSDTIRQTVLHSVLTAHNEQNPTRPAAFVAVVGERDEAAEIDDVQYFGIAAQRCETGAVRIDVDAESARAVFIDENREVALKKTLFKQKRTCEQCRRLADKGAYEESVQAYKEFIETHAGHFQIDDAYFAIAEIFDEKLFRFADALVWYRCLINEYPDGTLTPLANQRIRFLSAYSDCNYEPLARFERIRKIEFARKEHRPEDRSRLLEQVKSIINEYPNSNLAPVMQYWLANQYRQTDADKAVDAYITLQLKYPNFPEAKEVLADIGQTYYEAGRYDEAIEVYKEALSKLPSLEDTIKAQIARCKRNIRRNHISLLCFGVFALFGGLGVLIRPFGVDASKIISSLVAFAVLGVVLLFGAWLIYEQFSSVREMLLIVISFSATAAISSLISMTFADKLFAKAVGTGAGRNILSVAAGSVMGLILFTAGIYLVIYYINVHYLIVIGM